MANREPVIGNPQRLISAEAFLPRSPPQPLADGEIHLWFFPQWSDAAGAAADSVLVRNLLAAYVAAKAADLRIERGEHGKPRLASHRLEFNLSHSGGALLVGVSRRLPLGVDLETPRRLRPVLELARRWFDPAEAAALSALPDALRQIAFLRLWSAKEAVLKADGRGIGHGLHRVSFDLDTTGEIVALREADVASGPWQIVGQAPTPLHVGALAWTGSPVTVRSFLSCPE